MGHHHLGIDMDCLPAGTEIVKGTPSWVHFGTGATEIDVQLEPGTHKLTLQLGDDLHRTIEGFCQTITVPSRSSVSTADLKVGTTYCLDGRPEGRHYVRR